MNETFELSKEIEIEINRLKNIINQKSFDIKKLRGQIFEIETNINKFLLVYQQELGYLFEQISNLDNKIISESNIIQINENNQNIKKIYHRLAKKYHPDIDDKSNFFNFIKEAYQANNIEILIEIEKIDIKEYSILSIVKFEDILSNLNETENFLQSKLILLKLSNFYKLYKKNLWAKALGINLIDEIKKDAINIINKKIQDCSIENEENARHFDEIELEEI